MAIHVRLVTPITTEGFCDAGVAGTLGREGVKLDFVNVETGPASIECDYEIMLAQSGTIAPIIEAEREGADAGVIDCMARGPGLFGTRMRIPKEGLIGYSDIGLGVETSIVAE